MTLFIELIFFKGKPGSTESKHYDFGIYKFQNKNVYFHVFCVYAICYVFTFCTYMIFWHDTVKKQDANLHKGNTLI